MSMTHWWKLATVLLVAGATSSGVELLGQGGGPGSQPPSAKQDKDRRVGDAPTREVTPGKLKRIVSARGTVEAARTQDIYCLVEYQTTIIKIVPEGSMVKKGQVIGELDSAALRDQLVNQRITTKAAEGAYRRARLEREVADLALVEYKEGIYKQDVESLRQQVDGLHATILKNEGRRDRIRQASQHFHDVLTRTGGNRTPTDIVAEVDLQDRLEDAEKSLERDRRSLAEAQRKREILEKFTFEKTVKQLENETQKARSIELARQATWDLEAAKETKLEKQIASCTMKAPIDGTVLYANDPSRMFGTNQPQIEEGATVRERQKIVSILALNGPMQINAKVHESEIDVVAPRMSVRVKVDAFADATMPGVVTEVAPLPDPTRMFADDIKVYTIRVRIGQRREGLRPGMTASAEIVAADLDNVLSVPRGSVIRYGDKDHVAVKTADGRAEWRDVVLGASDGVKVEVKEGLQSGEKVVLEPGPFLSDDQQAIIKAEREAATKKDAERRALREARLKKAAEFRKARGAAPEKR